MAKSVFVCYLEGDGRECYLHDMHLCQRWAVLNRKLISHLLLRFFPGVDVVEGIRVDPQLYRRHRLHRHIHPSDIQLQSLELNLKNLLFP